MPRLVRDLRRDGRLNRPNVRLYRAVFTPRAIVGSHLQPWPTRAWHNQPFIVGGILWSQESVTYNLINTGGLND
jgi:hypothetical protein